MQKDGPSFLLSATKVMTEMQRNTNEVRNWLELGVSHTTPLAVQAMAMNNADSTARAIDLVRELTFKV